MHFDTKGYTVIKNFLEEETALLLFEYMKFSTQVMLLNNQDPYVSTSVPGCIGQRGADHIIESLLKFKTQRVEEIVGFELYPTYSVGRIYTNGNKLVRHVDRPPCEISVTVKLSDTKNYNYPFYIDGNEIFLEDGDAVIYKGVEIPHWREECVSEEKYFVAQLFLHYVQKGGKYDHLKYDRQKERELIMTDQLWNQTF
jgi:hypothetical protein